MDRNANVSCRELSGWVVATSGAKGIRGSMEDVTVVDGVLAVLDGHGGNECAKFVAPRLAVLADQQQDQWINTFTELDDAFRAQHQLSGSTCVIAVINGEELKIANLGDSRAVLYRGGAVIAHTVDHKPGAPSERERIIQLGGVVQEDGNGPARVAGVAVSRAFGTFVSPMNRKVLKDPAVPHAEHLVCCVPELYVWQAQPGDLLVMACDGVWDVLNEEEVGLAVFGEPEQGTRLDVAQTACMIVNLALKNSTDNVSVIVAELGGSIPALQQEQQICPMQPRMHASCPGFNNATRDEQLAIGAQSEYGETLIGIMEGLETDLIIPNLWLGQVGDACHLPFLEFVKATKILNCAAEIERPDIDGVEVFSLKWRDSEEQGKAEAKGCFRRLKQATSFLHRSMEAGEVALVHCVQGVSRSASVVVAYLMQYRRMSIEDAVLLVKEKHPVALKPFRFQEMLRAFHYHLADST